MSEHANTREKRLAMLVVAAVVLVTVLLIVETFRLLLPGLWSAFSAGDEQALSEYLASQGRLRSFLTLWFLAVVQVLSLVIPAMLVQLAAVRSALDNTGKVILKDHMRHCMVDAVAAGDQEAIEDLIQAIDKLVK
mgnify:CR=1 FL=1